MKLYTKTESEKLKKKKSLYISIFIPKIIYCKANTDTIIITF